MSDLYICEGQDALAISFLCQEYEDGKIVPLNLTGATVIIKYRNSVEEGQWEAEIDGPPVQGRVLFAFIVGEGIAPSGQWIVWPCVTFADGTYAPGKPHTFVVKKEGTA